MWRSHGSLDGRSVQTLSVTSSVDKLHKTERKPLYERGYRKSKDGMYAATELIGRGGFLGFVGLVIYKTIWATMLSLFCTIWLLTLGGKLLKEKEKTRSQND